VPFFQITRVGRTHRKVLGYLPAPDAESALQAWGTRELMVGDWLECEAVYGFGEEDGGEGTETLV
jgi:hypothetical protein